MRSFKNVDATRIRDIPDSFNVRPVFSSDDSIKIDLYESDPGRPDGKQSSAEHYVALERSKINAGYMTGFVVEFESRAVGCFCLARQANLVRLKNVFTAFEMRGIGCGSVMTAYAERFAFNVGATMFGSFAIAGQAGQRLYEKSGMKLVGVQTEFSAPLPSESFLER